MSKNILDNLFGSKMRVKVLKFLFRNYPQSFGPQQLANHTQEHISVIRREIDALREMRIIKRKP